MTCLFLALLSVWQLVPRLPGRRSTSFSKKFLQQPYLHHPTSQLPQIQNLPREFLGAGDFWKAKAKSKVKLMDGNQNHRPISRIRKRKHKLSWEDYTVTLHLPPLCSLKRLELLYPSRNLLFLSSFIMASPLLRELRIEMSYALPIHETLTEMVWFPSAKDVIKYDHKNLELVEMAGSFGSFTEKDFVVHLVEVASSLKRVVIESKHRPHHLVPTFP